MAGRRIDDQSNWIGARPAHAPLPEVGGKMMQTQSAEGFGALSEYEDTTDQLKTQQEMAKDKVHKYPRKHLNRN